MRVGWRVDFIHQMSELRLSRVQDSGVRIGELWTLAKPDNILVDTLK